MKRLLVILLAMLLLTACTAPAEQPAAPQAQATRAAIQELDFHPDHVGTLQSATLTWTERDDRSIVHTGALTEPEKLRTLEGILSGAEQVENVPMCFDGPARHELTLVRADGSIITVLVSLDECPYLREGDVCFHYERAAKELTGQESNAAIYDLFGVQLR